MTIDIDSTICPSTGTTSRCRFGYTHVLGITRLATGPKPGRSPPPIPQGRGSDACERFVRELVGGSSRRLSGSSHCDGRGFYSATSSRLPDHKVAYRYRPQNSRSKERDRRDRKMPGRQSATPCRRGVGRRDPLWRRHASCAAHPSRRPQPASSRFSAITPFIRPRRRRGLLGCDHRRHAVVGARDQSLRRVGLAHCPSGTSRGQAPGVLTDDRHNLIRWVAKLG